MNSQNAVSSGVQATQKTLELFSVMKIAEIAYPII